MNQNPNSPFELLILTPHWYTYLEVHYDNLLPKIPGVYNSYTVDTYVSLRNKYLFSYGCHTCG